MEWESLETCLLNAVDVCSVIEANPRCDSRRVGRGAGMWLVVCGLFVLGFSFILSLKCSLPFHYIKVALAVCVYITIYALYNIYNIYAH